jgi:tetratricopeptide (TPR) repeat protein
VDAYTAKKDWQSIKDYLSDQNWAGADFLRRATLARAHLEAGEALASQVNWKAALKAASDRPKALAALLTLLESWNWQNEREELLWVLVQRFPGERWAFQSLNDFYLASNNTRGLHKLYSSVIGYDVADAAAKNNFAATALLLNTQTNRAHELAREVYKVNPQNGIFASTYAYSLYLQGKVDEALRVFERLNPESLTAPSIAVYYGAVLAATDQRPKALKYLDLAEQGKLLPEEQALVAAVRAP